MALPGEPVQAAPAHEGGRFLRAPVPPALREKPPPATS